MISSQPASKQKKRARKPQPRFLTYSENPPSALQLVQHDPALLGLDRIDSIPTGEPAAELDHALGQTDLPQPLVALILRDVLGGLPSLRSMVALAAAAAALLVLLVLLPLLGLGVHRGVVDDLVVEGLVGGAERRVVDGKESQLRRHDGSCGRRGRGGGRHGGRWEGTAKITRTSAAAGGWVKIQSTEVSSSAARSLGLLISSYTHSLSIGDGCSHVLGGMTKSVSSIITRYMVITTSPLHNVDCCVPG